MKLETNKYTIKYIDTYNEGGYESNNFEIIIGCVHILIDYSKNDHQIVSTQILTEYREDLGIDDLSYIYAEDEAMDRLRYAEYEIKNVCKFMLDLY